MEFVRQNNFAHFFKQENVKCVVKIELANALLVPAIPNQPYVYVNFVVALPKKPKGLWI